MKQKLAAIVQGFNAIRAENPEQDVSVETQFEMYLVSSGTAHSFTEAELSEAAIGVGVDPSKVNDFMESLAAWL